MSPATIRSASILPENEEDHRASASRLRRQDHRDRRMIDLIIRNLSNWAASPHRHLRTDREPLRVRITPPHRRAHHHEEEAARRAWRCTFADNIDEECCGDLDLSTQNTTVSGFHLKMSVWGRAAGRRGAPGVAQRPTAARNAATGATALGVYRAASAWSARRTAHRP